MRVLACLSAVLFLSALGAAQQPPPPPPPPPQIDVPTNGPTPPVTPASTKTTDTQKVTVSADWLKQQSDDLSSVVACYLDKTSVDNLTKMETDEEWEVTKSIEVRIKLLAKLAKENTASHCQ